MIVTRATLAWLVAGTALPALGQAPAETAASDDIIVTTQKREERGIDVPITLVATSGERMRQLGVVGPRRARLLRTGPQHPGAEREQPRHRHPRHHIGLGLGATGSARHALLQWGRHQPLARRVPGPVRHRARRSDEAPAGDAVRGGIDNRPTIAANGGGSRFEVSVFARNLLDKDYLLDAGNTGGAFGIPSYIPAEPRL